MAVNCLCFQVMHAILLDYLLWVCECVCVCVCVRESEQTHSLLHYKVLQHPRSLGLTQLTERSGFDLPHSLRADVQDLCNLRQCLGAAVIEPIAHSDDLAVVAWQGL